jgi:hypothetical protein
MGEKSERIERAIRNERNRFRGIKKKDKSFIGGNRIERERKIGIGK